jgi:CheY-like chemotaxis protein
MPSDTTRPLAGIKLLLIDNDLPSIRLMIAALADEGCVIESAQTAAQALGFLLPYPPRLILLELDLPDMSGLELAKVIKSSPGCRDTVVVAVTARNGHETEQQVLDAGCSAYLRKPIDALGLPASLARLLGS